MLVGKAQTQTQIHRLFFLSLFLNFRKLRPQPGCVFTVGESWSVGRYLLLTVACFFQVALHEREARNRQLGRLGSPALSHRSECRPVKAEISFHSRHGRRLLSVPCFRPGNASVGAWRPRTLWAPTDSAVLWAAAFRREPHWMVSGSAGIQFPSSPSRRLAGACNVL